MALVCLSQCVGKVESHNQEGAKSMIPAVVAGVDTVYLVRSMEQICAGARHPATNPAHRQRVNALIRDSLKRYGYDVQLQQVKDSIYVGENIIARKDGHVAPKNKLIVSAHYDTTEDSPGADDDASGVAGLLEIARLLADIPLEHSVDLVFFDLKESHFAGSRTYVTRHSEEDENIIGVINLDMIGYMATARNSQRVPESIGIALPAVKRKVETHGNVGDFVVCVANHRSKDLKDSFVESMEKYVSHRKVIALLTPGNSELLGELRYGDHAAFWDHDIAAIFVGDGADSRNPNYHSERDQLGTIHFGFMKDIVQGALACTLKMCKPLDAATATKSTHTGTNQ